MWIFSGAILELRSRRPNSTTFGALFGWGSIMHAIAHTSADAPLVKQCNTVIARPIRIKASTVIVGSVMFPEAAASVHTVPALLWHASRSADGARYCSTKSFLTARGGFDLARGREPNGGRPLPGSWLNMRTSTTTLPTATAHHRSSRNYSHRNYFYNCSTTITTTTTMLLLLLLNLPLTYCYIQVRSTTTPPFHTNTSGTMSSP